MVLLTVEPAVQAVLVEGVPTLPFGDVADDVGVAQQQTVRTDRVQRLSADATVYRH